MKILQDKVFLCFMLITSTFNGILPINGQNLLFIDSLTNLIILEPPQSEKQKTFEQELLKQLVKYLHNPVLTESEESIIWSTIDAIQFRRGVYVALQPQPKPDTLSHEVVILEKKLNEWEDSITIIQKRLIEIVEEELQTRATKEKATQTLVKIHREDVLEYLMKNEEKLRFGIFNMDDETVESHRTAIWKIMLQIDQDNEKKWMVFPFMMRYFRELGFSEMGMIYTLLSWTNHPWSLLDFMYENASDESKPIIKEVIDSFPMFKKPDSSKD